MKVPFVPEPTERLRRRRRPVWLPAPIGLDWIGFIAPSLVFPLATTACPPKPAHHRRRRSLPSVHPPAPPGHHHDHYCYHYHHHHHARRHHRPKKQQSPAVSSFFPPLVVLSLAVSSCLPRAPFSSPFPSSGPQGAAEPAADDSTVDRRRCTPPGARQFGRVSFGSCLPHTLASPALHRAFLGGERARQIHGPQLDDDAKPPPLGHPSEHPRLDSRMFALASRSPLA